MTEPINATTKRFARVSRPGSWEETETPFDRMMEWIVVVFAALGILASIAFIGYALHKGF